MFGGGGGGGGGLGGGGGGGSMDGCVDVCGCVDVWMGGCVDGHVVFGVRIK